MGLTKNSVTGETHTATVPAIILFIVGVVFFGIGLFSKPLGIPENGTLAIAIGLALIGAAGINIGAMAVKRNGSNLPAPPTGG